MQNTAGITYINSYENLLPVLTYTLGEIENAEHVKPIIYQDKELVFITEAQSKGVGELRESNDKVFGAYKVQTIPYSSVFLELDCAYWNREKEAGLRESMKKKAGI